MPKKLPKKSTLSLRELIVVGAFADGWGAKQVAMALGISTETVNVYLKRAKQKWKLEGYTVRNRSEMRAHLEKQGLMRY